MSIIVPADLASHHDAALRQAARAHLTLTIRQLMIDITQDPMALAKVVTGERDVEREIPASETALVDEIKANFAAVTDIEREQRLREREDLQFAAGDQWLPEHTKARAAQTTPDGHTIPARPCLTVNLLDQPIEQIITEARDAHLGLKVTPKAGVGPRPSGHRRSHWRTKSAPIGGACGAGRAPKGNQPAYDPYR